MRLCLAWAEACARTMSRYSPLVTHLCYLKSKLANQCQKQNNKQEQLKLNLRRLKNSFPMIYD